MTDPLLDPAMWIPYDLSAWGSLQPRDGAAELRQDLRRRDRIDRLLRLLDGEDRLAAAAAVWVEACRQEPSVSPDGNLVQLVRATEWGAFAELDRLVHDEADEDTIRAAARRWWLGDEQPEAMARSYQVPPEVCGHGAVGFSG